MAELIPRCVCSQSYLLIGPTRMDDAITKSRRLTCRIIKSWQTCETFIQQLIKVFLVLILRYTIYVYMLCCCCSEGREVLRGHWADESERELKRTGERVVKHMSFLVPLAF